MSRPRVSSCGRGQLGVTWCRLCWTPGCPRRGRRPRSRSSSSPSTTRTSRTSRWGWRGWSTSHPELSLQHPFIFSYRYLTTFIASSIIHSDPLLHLRVFPANIKCDSVRRYILHISPFPHRKSFFWPFIQSFIVINCEITKFKINYLTPDERLELSNNW